MSKLVTDQGKCPLVFVVELLYHSIRSINHLIQKSKCFEYISMNKPKLQPHKSTSGVKYKVIQLTDIKLHSTKKVPTPSLGKKVRESFQNNTPGRVYNHIPEHLEQQGDNSFILNVLQYDPDFMKMVQEEAAKGYKVVIAIPKKGIPVLLGEDTIEFMNSKNGKRILRGIDKSKK
jgi:hypothetical protein